MRTLPAALALALFSTPASAVTPEFATYLLIFGPMAFGVTESEHAYRVEGTTTIGSAAPAPSTTTIRKNQGCVVAIETEVPTKGVKEVRTTDWTRVLVDEIRVLSRPAPEGGPEASYRRIVIQGRERFMCVRMAGRSEGGEAASPVQERCTDRLALEAAHVTGGRNMHDLQKQALTAIIELCFGRQPNLEPQPAP